MPKSNYLSQQDIKMIQNKITTIFEEETNKQITLNVNELNKEIDYIIKKVQLTPLKKSKYRISRVSGEKKALMAEAYIIIFKVREFLLNETINYRYYYNTDEKAKVIQFEEKDILKYIKFGQEGLKIADNILKKQEDNSQYQDLIERHYNNLIAGVQQASNSSFQVVHSYIMNKYEVSNPGLRKKSGSYQVFTRGHIFEAMDIAFSEAIEKNQIEDYEAIENYMYGKYLNYDNIIATKGGDNAITMTQIKANAADLLDYKTLLLDLEQLKKIFDIKNINKDKIKYFIESLYLDATKYQDINDFNDAIEKSLDKVIKSLTNQKIYVTI